MSSTIAAVSLPVPLNVVILLFDEVEVLDFCGPFEVFSVAGRERETRPFRVVTCAPNAQSVATAGGLSVNPQFGLEECPAADVLVIPGGWGTRKLMNEPAVIEWIERAAAGAEVVLSVCTGALLLARAGLLDGLKVTTHHGALGLLAEVAPRATVEAGRRFIDNGKVVTSAGISAGIDASLHVVGRLLGVEVARAAAGYMEYEWRGGD